MRFRDAVLAGAMLFAAAFMAYSGLVLSSWNSIAFWNTPLLPILTSLIRFWRDWAHCRSSCSLPMAVKS